MRKVKTIIKNHDSEVLGLELYNFVCNRVSDNISRHNKMISIDEIEVTISGEEVDVLRFQTDSKFKFVDC